MFFRDILDGPLYIVIAILNFILICSCIGYLGEQYLNKKKEKKLFKENTVVVSNVQSTDTSLGVMASNAQNMVSTLQEANSVAATGSSVVNNAYSGYSNVSNPYGVNGADIPTGANNSNSNTGM